MAFWKPFFPFGLKWKPLLRRPAMTSIQTLALEIKNISSSFKRSFYIFNIFHYLRAVNESKIKVWKGKILGPSRVKKFAFEVITLHCKVNRLEFQIFDLDILFWIFIFYQTFKSNVRVDSRIQRNCDSNLFTVKYGTRVNPSRTIISPKQTDC